MANVSVNTTKPSFPQFDVDSDHSDHHYADTKHDNLSNTAKKTIMHEWKILEHNLPETIYVRAYESRIDLLRSVIVGVEGTPYEHGLFFFDIKFPNNYPNKPPQVRYLSHGLGLNPNLHDSGYVCLSLLNTWLGLNSCERWDPSRSTVLQVLVSIQGLVLNEKPVANDPIFGFLTRWFGMRSWSRSYNDEAFVNTRRSMLYLLRSPPGNFEAFVAEHFRIRASRILKGCYEFKRHGCYGLASKEMMWQLYPILVNAFEENRAQLVNAVKKGDDDGAQKLFEDFKSSKLSIPRLLRLSLISLSINAAFLLLKWLQIGSPILLASIYSIITFFVGVFYIYALFF